MFLTIDGHDIKIIEFKGAQEDVIYIMPQLTAAQRQYLNEITRKYIKSLWQTSVQTECPDCARIAKPPHSEGKP